MSVMNFWLAALLIFVSRLDVVQPRRRYSDDVVFYVLEGQRLSARELAGQHGLQYISEVFPGSRYHHATVMKERTLDLISMEKLSTDPRVIFIKLNIFFIDLNHDLNGIFLIAQIVWAEKQIYQRRDLRFISSAQGRRLVDEEDISNWTDDNEIESDGSEMFNDPQYPLQWYLV